MSKSMSVKTELATLQPSGNDNAANTFNLITAFPRTILLQ
jgi:hypothetical protein